MEPIYRQQFHIDQSAVDCFSRLTLSRLLLFAQEVAGHHSNLLGLSYEQLAEKGVFWAVVRNRVQITRMPTEGETITLETWPMPTTRTAYPRSTVAYDAEGKVLFRSVSLWVLMNTTTRALVLPRKSDVVVNGILRGSELEIPQSLSAVPFSNVRSRTVSFTDLDRNYHMNNARYLDWVNDLLPRTFHQAHPVQDFTLCYMNEALEGECLNVNWDMDESGDLQVEIQRNSEEFSANHDRIFAAKLHFDNVVL